ncbi:hypothetical protein Tco_1074104, partial [Tanacetum coccineum]
MLRLELHKVSVLAVGKLTLGLLPRYTSRKESWGSNSGNTGDGGKIVGGAIGACGKGI